MEPTTRDLKGGHAGGAEIGSQDKQCRYCLGSALDVADEFISPCACSGGQQWVHLECLRRWQRSLLVTQPTHPLLQTEDTRTTHCGVCTERFRYPPPSRHEMLMSFTGAELAALVQEKSLICASESFSSELRAGLHADTNRRSITDFVHWCRAVYFIYYAGPKRLVLNVPDEENRFAILEALSSTGLLTLRGRQYRVLEEGPLENLSLHNRGNSALTASSALVPRGRGAEWVESAINNCKSDATDNILIDANPLSAAIANLPIPAELTVEVASVEEKDTSDDAIRALNLGNRIAPHDLSDEVQMILQRAIRESTVSPSLLSAVDIQHYLGGPCAPTQCIVIAPLGSDDGIIPPLPHGFKALPTLGIVVGTDLAIAIRRLAMVREPPRPEQPLKKRRVVQVDVPDVRPPMPKEMPGSDWREDIAQNHSDDDSEHVGLLEDEVSSAGSDVNAGELIASPPSTPSCDENETIDGHMERNGIDGVDMLVSIAAESLGGDVASSALHTAGEPENSENRHASLRPLLVFWGEARWQRTQLLGELARGDWGLCQASREDLLGQAGLWQRIAAEEHRPILAPRSEMTREAQTDASAALRALRRLVAAHREALRQQGQEQQH